MADSEASEKAAEEEECRPADNETADAGNGTPGADVSASVSKARGTGSELPGKPKHKSFDRSILEELGIKVIERGVILPESRKTFLRRRRENRQRAIDAGEVSAIVPVDTGDALSKKRKRNRPKSLGVHLNELESQLFYAAHQGSPEAVASCRAAVEEGVDVNVRTKADMDGVGTAATALHVAAVRGHKDVVLELLKADADVLATTGRGETPVQLATRMGHVDVVKALRGKGGAPVHVEGMSQLMDKAPSSWNEEKRKKLRKALGPMQRNSVRALPAPPPAPPTPALPAPPPAPSALPVPPAMPPGLPPPPAPPRASPVSHRQGNDKQYDDRPSSERSREPQRPSGDPSHKGTGKRKKGKTKGDGKGRPRGKGKGKDTDS